MNREQAKRLLLLHRPGLGDEGDLELGAALALLETDPELRRWFEAQRTAQDAIRREFRRIAPPPALKEQIISERPWHTRPVRVRHLVAVAAVVVVLVGIGLWRSSVSPHEDRSFAAFRSRMVGTVLRSYPPMDLATNDLGSIRAFLKEHGGIGNFEAPQGLAQTPVTGCLTLTWRRAPVSLICFKTGRPLPPMVGGDLWFFVVDHAVVPDAPASEMPQIAKLNDVTTASWTREGKTYVLAVEGDESRLKRFLNPG